MANNKNQHYRKNVVWNKICIFISLDGKVSSTTRPSDPPPSSSWRGHILQSGAYFRCLFIYPIMIDSVINNTHALRNQKVFAAQHFSPWFISGQAKKAPSRTRERLYIPNDEETRHITESFSDKKLSKISLFDPLAIYADSTLNFTEKVSPRIKY